MTRPVTGPAVETGASAGRAIEVAPSAGALADAAARRFVVAAADAIDARGAFVVALAGGSTPRAMYERLALEPFAANVQWSRVHFLWGDERCVPPDHADSNYRMARETLLDHVPVAAENVHRIHGEDDPVAAAGRYETLLRAMFRTPTGPPPAVAGVHIDLVLLGLGADGHTASIFPGSAAVSEPTRWVIAEHVAAAAMWRITLTPAVINSAAAVLFLVSGPAKATVLRRVLEGPHDQRALPAQAIAPSDGRVRWLVDAEAAGELGRRGS